MEEVGRQTQPKSMLSLNFELKFDQEKSTGVAHPRETGPRQTEHQVQRLCGGN